MESTYLVGRAALIGAEHDDVGGSVGELLSVESLVVLEQLHVSTTALQAVYKLVSIAQLLRRKRIGLPWSLTSYWTTRVLPLLSMALGNLAEMAWWAALSLMTRPLSPTMPGSTEGSSTDQVPTYAHSSSSALTSFFACEGFHRSSQSSVNCSRNGALSLVGCGYVSLGLQLAKSRKTYGKGRLCYRGRCRRLGLGGACIVCAHDGGSERVGGTNCKTHCACLLSE
jgi:hypothetical protein